MYKLDFPCIKCLFSFDSRVKKTQPMPQESWKRPQCSNHASYNILNCIALLYIAFN